LISGWQFTKNQQVGNFQKVRLGGQVFNGISAIAKNAFVTIQKSNSTFGGSGIFISKVERNGTGFFKQVTDVNTLFSFRTFNDRKCIGFSVYVNSAVFAMLEKFKY
jgi:hypothetical protein